MKYRPLGKSGLQVSAVGFGTWGIGGNSGGAVAYGPTDDAESKKALRRALERGVTFYDTSDLYGYGHSEELLGEAFSGERSKVVIATKVGMIEGGKKQDFSRGHMLKSVEASLKRLRTDYIDLYLLHNPPSDILEGPESPLRVMEELKAKGTIRAFGVSLRSPEDGLIVAQKHAVACVQANFNLADQRASESGLFDRCAEKGIGIVVRTPLVGGFLTGRYAPTTSFGEFDQRKRWSPAQIERWNQSKEFFAEVMAKHPEDSQTQFALRFCLSYPQVSTVIPGMLTSAHVDENTEAGDRSPLDPADVAKVYDKYKSVEFFVKG
ncbi:MAG: aldo/keto reductase [Elusimicrobia bacterium]|nr:aldo/keto reductase [Elusimicrobiota bacterium]